MIVSSNSGEGHKNRKAVPGYEEIHGPHFYGRQAVGRQLRKHCALILNASLHALAFSGRAALVVDALGALLRACVPVCVSAHTYQQGCTPAKHSTHNGGHSSETHSSALQLALHAMAQSHLSILTGQISSCCKPQAALTTEVWLGNSGQGGTTVAPAGGAA
eukprot:scaffold78390_cov17-Tisochrysis_lutea.AAC.1